MNFFASEKRGKKRKKKPETEITAERANKPERGKRESAQRPRRTKRMRGK